VFIGVMMRSASPSASIVAVAATQRSFLWRITENGQIREVAISGSPTASEVHKRYPDIWSNQNRLQRLIREASDLAWR